jgi:hypothetical protein
VANVPATVRLGPEPIAWLLQPLSVSASGGADRGGLAARCKVVAPGSVPDSDGQGSGIGGRGVPAG